MKAFLVLMLCAALSLNGWARSPILPSKVLNNFEKSVETTNGLPDQIYMALDSLIHFTAISLRENGFFYEADDVETRWMNEFEAELRAYLYSNRAIPDHSPLLAFLDDVMNMVIEKMGRPFCVSSHICDIYTFNKTIKIAINVLRSKCDFDMVNVTIPMKDEFRACMTTDGNFTGLFPVLIYWIIMGGCMAAGGVFVCGALATVGEMICKNHLCGPLSDRMFSKHCEPSHS